MRYTQTSIPGLWLIEPVAFGDERGYFMEVYRAADFARHIEEFSIVQENQSRSRYGVLRGLHLQQGAHAQAKLVRCVEGCVLDVAVDLRKGSPTYGQHLCFELSDSNHREVYIPRGFAHGFLTLSEHATLQYKVDNAYHPESECSIRYDDPDLAIDWAQGGIPAVAFVLSAKDLDGISFELYQHRSL